MSGDSRAASANPAAAGASQGVATNPGAFGVQPSVAPTPGPSALVFGEVLWDLLPSGAVLGGAPFNFAYRLAGTGVATRFVSAVGSDDLGRKTLAQMETLGMDTSLVAVSSDLPTATVVVELDEQRQPHYTIVENVAYDAVPWSDDLAAAASSADILCFGTLAQRHPRSRATLRRIVDSFGGDTVLVDINLRPKCWTQETVRWSLERGTIAKLNDEELVVIAELYGLEGTGRELPALAMALRKAIGLESLVVTLGDRGALAVHGDDEPVIVPGFVVEVDDPCGAGDAFAGSFLGSLLDGASLEMALTRGNALGALVASRPGATGLVSGEQIDTLIRTGTRRGLAIDS